MAIISNINGNMQNKIDKINNSLNGFAAYNTPAQLKISSYYIPDIVAAMPANSVFRAAVISGQTYALADSNNAFPINAGNLEITKPAAGRTRVLFFSKTNDITYGLYYAVLDENAGVINSWNKFSTGSTAVGQ